jgi:hypothetical protein
MRPSTPKRAERNGRATRRYEDDDVQMFDPHVLLELDGLREGIDRIRHAALRRALLLVLSASLTR